MVWMESNSEGVKPSRVYAVSTLFSAVLVELYNRLGDHTKALRWAALYLTYAQHSLFSALPGLCTMATAALQTFARTEATLPQLVQLLHILKLMSPRYQSLTPILQPYALCSS